MIRVLVEVVLMALVAAFFATQVFWPAWRGKPLFPVFGGSRRLDAGVRDATQDLDNARVESEIRELRARARAERSSGGERRDGGAGESGSNAAHGREESE